MPKQSATAAASLDAAPAESAAARDYVVVRGRVERAGKMYDTGDTIALTNAEAAHPLATGAVRLREAE